MVDMLPLIFLTLLSGVALINPTIASPSVILEKIEAKSIPPGWTFDYNATSSDKLTLTIALKEPGFADIKARLHQRQFGGNNHHLSREQIHTYLQPKTKNIETIKSWLKSNAGVKNVHVQGRLLSFEATARQVKDLFSADLKHYTYSSGDDDEDLPRTTALRALSYHIPSWLRAHINFVHPITNFMPPRRGGRPIKKPSKPTTTRKPPSSSTKPPSTKKTTSTTTKKASTTTTKRASSTTTKKAPATTTKRPSSSTKKPTTTSRPIGIPTITSALPQETGSPDPEEPYEGNYPCLVATSPRCIKQLYNITYPPYNPATSPRSPVNFGVAGFLEQWILHADVAYFLSQYQPDYLYRSATPSGPYNFTVELINGGINPQHDPANAGIEASLDVEYAMALGYPTNVIYYVTGGRGTKLDSEGKPFPLEEIDNEPYLEFLEALLAKPDSELPHVLSISYADDEISVPRPYALRVCDLFAVLAARGVSTFVASGDGGAAGTGQTRCVMNDGSQKKMFIPTFPASCPYVTAVGAVDNVAPPFTGEDFSAGGFSNYFDRPIWQDEVVKPYVDGLVARKDPRVGLFNSTGRAMPDISVIGSGFQIIMGGEMSEVLGTSASAPVVAAMVALINDARMRAGKSSLGWLNPLLYSAKVKAVLRDVTIGESYGCLFPDGSRQAGWPAAQGYDCITGLGAVKEFGELMAALL
ncbi:putative Tripeptidyl-peptidase precursor [Triangularia setosa]|uniref:tripeptidyl-peptidase II n=1 Tax=Triangularia setosa TaxID=2587417 RepID=A0AAN6W6U2_9PEZI|nr:putative Tripeptidyl-peptidase precursor [Podospora setosa]